MYVHALMGAESTPGPPVIRTIGVMDLKDALARGISDFSAMPPHVFFLCLIYPIVGLILARVSLGYDVLSVLFPLAAGFALLGPFVAIGFYELSRRPRFRISFAKSSPRAPAGRLSLSATASASCSRSRS